MNSPLASGESTSTRAGLNPSLRTIQRKVTIMSNTNTTQRGRGLAIGALITGIVGLGVGLIPFLFVGAWILAAVALLLGVLGFRGSRIVATLGVLAAVGAFSLGVVGLNATDEFVQDVDDSVNELEQDLDDIDG